MSPDIWPFHQVFLNPETGEMSDLPAHVRPHEFFGLSEGWPQDTLVPSWGIPAYQRRTKSRSKADSRE